MHYTQAYRAVLVERPDALVARKRARIVAVQVQESFTVDTDRGVMAGHPGDWIVTNHPDDDAGSDLWTISDDRMQATYEAVE